MGSPPRWPREWRAIIASVKEKPTQSIVRNLPVKKRPLKEILLAMPSVGEDSDFERIAPASRPDCLNPFSG
jgi:hypothetical protein